jgi:hypothetical protein
MRKAAWLPFVALLVGCSSDNSSSMARDYRDMNNECIDALMMTTGESRARIAVNKILKTYTERVGTVDKRLSTWLQNSDEKYVVRDVLSSESVATLFAECQTNQKRLKLEQLRIQKLLDSHVAAEVDRRRLGGEANPVVDPRKEWPNLAELASGGQIAGLKSNLEKGTQLGDLVKKFPGKDWQKHWPPDFKELSTKFDERVKNLQGT